MLKITKMELDFISDLDMYIIVEKGTRGGSFLYASLVNNENDYLKCTSKPSYMSHKIFDNNLVEIRKNKLSLHTLECVFRNWVKY